jgi:hypothetical protein
MLNNARMYIKIYRTWIKLMANPIDVISSLVRQHFFIYRNRIFMVKKQGVLYSKGIEM